MNSTNGDPKFASPSVGALARPPHLRTGMLFAALVAMCPHALNGRLRARQREVLARIAMDQATIPSPTAIRVLSLGHMEWAADVLYTSALVYYGETLQQRSKQRFLQTYARTIEDVDPAFRGAYLWGATVSIYSPRIITRESVENANGHLRRGLAQFPDDGEMLFQLGFNHLIEIKPFERNNGERRENVRLGAAYLQRAAALGHGPQWLALSAAGFLDESGEGVGAIELLRVTLLRTEDPAIRARIERRIETLAGSEADPGLQFARRVDAERRANFPYVSPPLYLFAGPAALHSGARTTAPPISSTGD